MVEMNDTWQKIVWYVLQTKRNFDRNSKTIIMASKSDLPDKNGSISYNIKQQKCVLECLSNNWAYNIHLLQMFL